MTTSIHNPSNFGKLAALLFTRQTPAAAAERHPSLLKSLETWRARRLAQTELNNLSDRELADIGVIRQQIPDLVIRGQR